MRPRERQEEGRRPFKDPHYLNVAKTLPYPTWSEGRREGALFAYSRARRPLMSDRASGRGMNKCRRLTGDAVAVRFGSIGRTTRNYGQIRYLKGARGSSLILLPSLLPPARQHFVAEQRQLPAICLPSTTFTGIRSLPCRE